MMMMIVVIAIALSASGLFYFVVWSRRQTAAQSPRPLDLRAFRTLMDRDDELFLREKLAPGKFHHLKRRRISVTFKYVSLIASNAATVMRLAEAAHETSDPAVAEAVARLVEVATEVRKQCIVAFAKMGLEYAFPSLQLSPATLVPRYQALRENLSRLAVPQKQVLLPAGI